MPFMSVGLTVDRDDGRPLYAQVCEAIHQQIQGHTLLPGEALPSEAELQRIFGVARSVVRQALARLVELGDVERTQGRISIVTPRPEWRRQAQRAGGLRQQFAAHGQTLTTRVVSFASTTAPTDVADELGAADTWRIERCRSVDGLPVAFVRTWIPQALFPDLHAAQLHGEASLHDIMRAAGHHPVGGRRHVQAVPADDYLAVAMEVPIGAPLLLLDGVTRDADDRGLEWFSVWHRGHTVFDIDAAVAPEPQIDPGELAGLRKAAQLLSTEVANLNRRLDAM